jgi:hypothetical protein
LRPSTLNLPQPSSFYRAGLWRFRPGGRADPAGRIGEGLLRDRGRVLFTFCGRQRREVVVQNFLPVLAGDRAAAEKAAHRLHRKFALKLVDLWRVESGVPVSDWLTNPPNWKSFGPPSNADAASFSSRFTSAIGNMAACC